MEYANPRLSEHGKTVTFSVQRTPRGERAVRVDSHGSKKLPYTTGARIVDGSDGRLYVAQWVGEHNFIAIMKRDFRFMRETIRPEDAGFAKLQQSFTKEDL